MHQIDLFRPTVLPVETEFRDGNVSCEELRSLNGLVERHKPSVILEIGTFDGRTTTNLAKCSTPGAVVYTIDLPRGQAPAFDTSRDDAKYITCDKPLRYLKYPDLVEKVVQLYGDSGTYDFRRFRGKVDFLFVDGCHTYEYAYRDTVTAYELVRPGGTIVWHDYGAWRDVTVLLDGLDSCLERDQKLIHIRSTTLVYHIVPLVPPRFVHRSGNVTN